MFGETEEAVVEREIQKVQVTYKGESQLRTGRIGEAMFGVGF